MSFEMINYLFKNNYIKVINKYDLSKMSFKMKNYILKIIILM